MPCACLSPPPQTSFSCCLFTSELCSTGAPARLAATFLICLALKQVLAAACSGSQACCGEVGEALACPYLLLHFYLILFL